MRKLSDVVRTVKHEAIKADDLYEIGEFTLVDGLVLDTRFGQRVAFTVEFVDEGEVQTRTLYLAADGYRLAVLEALKDGPLGPVVLVKRPTQYGNPYWMIVDAE